MQTLETIISKISRSLDFIAGITLAATAFLVVANILGRTLLNRSILGTYEIVGYLTAAVVGLALARCALENGHIAIGFILERFSVRMQRLVEVIVGIPAVVLLCFTTYQLVAYGSRIAETGEVSPTTQIIFYPFIYLMALGFFVLTLVVLFKLIQLLVGSERA